MLIEEEYKIYKQKNHRKILYLAVIVTFIALFCLSYGTDTGFSRSLTAIYNYLFNHTIAAETAAIDKIIIFCVYRDFVWHCLQEQVSLFQA